MKPTLTSELWELIERFNTKETLPQTGLRRTYLSQLQAHLKKHKLLSPMGEEWIDEE